jgi:hypothetical protein
VNLWLAFDIAIGYAGGTLLIRLIDFILGALRGR